MMEHLAIASFLIIVMAAPAAAQGKGRKSGRVPPGHLPPPGECRVWHDGVPPGKQPPPTSCGEAERVAARSGARVIYGDGRRNDRIYRGEGGGSVSGERGRDGRRDRNDRDDRAGTDDRRPTGNSRERTGRAIPRTDRDPSRDPDARRSGAREEQRSRPWWWPF